MKILKKRYDILAVVCLFFLSIFFEYNELFSLLEDQTLTLRHAFRNRYGDTSFSSDKIVLINVDEEFFKQYNGFPLRRTDIGKIITNLKNLGAKVIGVDMLMDFTSSYGEDPVFAQMLKNAGNVVLASRAVFEEKKFIKMIYPVPLFTKYSTSGYVNIASMSSITSINRLRIYPEITKENDGWPIAVQLLSKYFDVKPSLENNILKIGNIEIQLDQFSDLYIDFPVIPEGAKFISQYAGITALEFLDISNLDEDELYELSYWVKDKIVLLGDTSMVSHDWFDTPVGMVYGVEIIADTIDTILKGASLKPASFSLEIIFCLAFLFCIFLCHFYFQNPKLQTFIAVICNILFIIICTILYVYNDLIISMTYSIIAGIFSYIALNLYSYIEERNQKQQIKQRENFIRNTFGRYLSDEIVQNILDTPGGLKLGGEKKMVTIMMTDLRGFTAIGERLPPEDVVSIINNYLEVMTPIIIKYQGTIDEFIGDAILTIFGAPISRQDDTERAVACAVEMQMAMDIVNSKNSKNGFPAVEQGIGLNTGEVIVGNIGSELRSKYGVVGKNVNLTARIESYTVGGQIYIPDSTKHIIEKNSGDILIIGSQMEVSPKGVKNPINIYEIRGITGKYGLKMPAIKPELMINLKDKPMLEIVMLSGKHASNEIHTGDITSISKKNILIDSNLTVEKLNNLKITLFDHNNNEISKDLYGKVIEIKTKTLFKLEFTSIPPQAEKYLNDLLKKDTTINSKTGIYSKDYILEILKLEIDEALKYKTCMSIALFELYDFQYIKQKNKALIDLSKILKDNFYQSVSIGHFEQASILAVIPGYNIKKAEEFAGNIFKNLSEKNFSICCAVCGLKQRNNSDQLIKDIKNLLNIAKKNGPNSLEIDSIY